MAQPRSSQSFIVYLNQKQNAVISYIVIPVQLFDMFSIVNTSIGYGHLGSITGFREELKVTKTDCLVLLTKYLHDSLRKLIKITKLVTLIALPR